ncbi:MULTISPECIES: hypothetical protein [unclassified Actinotalea]|uniref:hypothetical protein n=1 Tax=unclassified Actinotalea TaxID=2638618 RepID=UPI0015F70D31|nr:MULTISPECIES: hypothetical protein [unclassified Actinotalea]
MVALALAGVLVATPTAAAEVAPTPTVAARATVAVPAATPSAGDVLAPADAAPFAAVTLTGAPVPGALDMPAAAASSSQVPSAYALAPAPLVTAPAPDVVKPDASSTGVRAGSRLQTHRGDIVVTQPGTVLENLDVYGFVTVKAADVTIRNTRVRGSGPGSFDTGLINANDARVKNLVVEDVTLVPDFPSYWINGMLGHDYTARRVNTWNVVDGFGIYNIHGTAANVRVESSYVHDLAYFSPDPNHSDNQTHNDAIQIQGGSNIQILGNTLSVWRSTTAGTQNYAYPQGGFGVILTPNVNAVTNSRIDGNWVDGAHIPIKLVTSQKTGPMNFGEVTNNTFARDMRNTPMAGKNNWFTVLTTPDLTVITSGNVYADDGTAIEVRRDSGTGTAP